VKRLAILAVCACAGAVATIVLAARVGITWLGIPMLIVACLAAFALTVVIMESRNP
jgi:hypothetical protein